MKLALSELVALYHVLSYISVKDLLTHAMNDMDNSTVLSKDNASILFYAIHTYLI